MYGNLPAYSITPTLVSMATQSKQQEIFAALNRPKSVHNLPVIDENSYEHNNFYNKNGHGVFFEPSFSPDQHSPPSIKENKLQVNPLKPKIEKVLNKQENEK